MKTIEELNEASKRMGVKIITFTWQPEWRVYSPLGGEPIMYPCGCNDLLLELYPQPSGVNRSRKHRIKCQKTGKKGNLILDGSAMALIEDVVWDD